MKRIVKNFIIKEQKIIRKIHEKKELSFSQKIKSIPINLKLKETIERELAGKRKGKKHEYILKNKKEPNFLKLVLI